MTDPLTGEQRAELRAHWQGQRLYPGPAKEARDLVLRLLTELDRVHTGRPLSAVARRSAAPRIPLPPPSIDDTWTNVEKLVTWLNDADTANGFAPQTSLLLRMLKINEEAGEVAGAVVGATGQNPRKGVTHTWDDVADELIDTAIAAMSALLTLRKDAPQVFARRLKSTVARAGVQEVVAEENETVSAE